MNIELLRKVQDKILAEPAQFAMGEYFQDEETQDGWSIRDIPRDIPNCKTAACISGWAITIDLQDTPRLAKRRVEDYFARGRLILGLSYEQAIHLFHLPEWSGEFRDRWQLAITVEERAKVASDYIDYFIEHGGDIHD